MNLRKLNHKELSVLASLTEENYSFLKSELNADYIPLIKKRLFGDQNQTSLNPNKIEVIK